MVYRLEAGLICLYAWTHPLEFMAGHKHCIKIAGLALNNYADSHEGRFPFHPDGYGNALLQIDEDVLFVLTGPGYDDAPLRESKRENRPISEEECGRVYVQGLTQKSNHEIVILFDKLPTPGGDHCHFPDRFFRPLVREVVLVGGSMSIVREEQWPEFAKKQIELLVREGVDRNEAERLYASKPK